MYLDSKAKQEIEKHLLDMLGGITMERYSQGHLAFKPAMNEAAGIMDTYIARRFQTDPTNPAIEYMKYYRIKYISEFLKCATEPKTKFEDNSDRTRSGIFGLNRAIERYRSRHYQTSIFQTAIKSQRPSA